MQLTGTYTQAGDWKAKFPTLITLFYEHDNFDIADCNSVRLQNTNLVYAWLIPKSVL